MRASTLWSHRPRTYAFLRNYDTGYPDLEVGGESTPQAYLEALWAATAEMMRVLKPTGSAFIDLGDTYSSTTKGSGGTGKSTLGIGADGIDRMNDHGRLLGQLRSQTAVRRIEPGVPAKSLMLLPERYRVGCVDRLGLIARAVIVWNKPNGLPESVVDRVRRSHEDWVHLTKQGRYYSATDEIREPHAQRTYDQAEIDARSSRQLPRAANGHAKWSTPDMDGRITPYTPTPHPLGKLPGSVWTIPSEPLTLPGYFISRDGTLVDFLAPTRGRSRPRPNGHAHDGLFDADAYAQLLAGEDAGAWRWLRATGINASPWPKTPDGLQLHTAASHYAAFPSEWPRRLIKGFSPPGICVECGQGRVPVVERGEYRPSEPNGGPRHVRPDRPGPHARESQITTTLGYVRDATILGYACSCTPFTDHPERRQRMVEAWPDHNYGDHNRIPPSGRDHNRDAAERAARRAEVGPVREYHLDRWTPPPTRPAVVLDCFGGTGTVAMVARALGRIGVSVDLSHAYSRAARWRIRHDGAKAISRTNLERQGSLL